MPRKPNKPLDYFQLIDTVIAHEDGRTTHIPELSDGFGMFSGFYPYVAAQKAVTNIYKWMKVHVDGFNIDEAPSLVFVMQRFKDGMLFAFYGIHVIHKQAPRTLTSPAGRERTHRWRSVVYSVDLDRIGYGGFAAVR